MSALLLEDLAIVPLLALVALLAADASAGRSRWIDAGIALGAMLLSARRSMARIDTQTRHAD